MGPTNTYLKYANPRESSSKISALASAQDPPAKGERGWQDGQGVAHPRAPAKAWLAGILRNRSQHAVGLNVTSRRISALKVGFALPMILLTNIRQWRSRPDELLIVLQVQPPSPSPVVVSWWPGPGLSKHLHPSIARYGRDNDNDSCDNCDLRTLAR